MAVLQQKTTKQNQHREKAQGWHPEETGQAPKGPLPANSGRTPRLLLAGSCDHVEVSLAQEVARDAAAGRLPGLGVRRLGACAQREPRSDGPCVGTAMSSWRHQLGAVGTPLKSKSPRTAPEDSSPCLLGSRLLLTSLPAHRSVHSVLQRPVLSPALARLTAALGTSASLPEPTAGPCVAAALLAPLASRHRSSAAL